MSTMQMSASVLETTILSFTMQNSHTFIM